MSTAETAIDLFSGNSGNQTIDGPYPTSFSTARDSSPTSHLSNVFVYVSIFFSLLFFLLLLLLIALQRLKNVIASSSSGPEYTDNTESPIANLEVCSLSSRTSGLSALSG
ncbi:serine-rich and transmembrane domain-containing protein 1 [Scyliorhinus torazame]|uniref:serine-rich and transmembrane domain-containing protein 1 n=1 Tax=Scyliorhinus torazame TaxID=75743 RepID=UPI003B5AE469